MTLSIPDNKILDTWFTTLQTLEKGSEAYLALRNKIYTFIYKRLMDMLETKVYEWKRKYALEEEDCISIFHDSLLNCVEKYDPTRVKFITYFWRSCENAAKNYYKKYRCKRRIPTSHIFNVDFDDLHNQAEIVSAGTKMTANGLEDTSNLCNLSDPLRQLYDKEEYQQEMTQLATDNIMSLLPSLTAVEAQIFEKVCEGHSVASISKLLNIKLQQVDSYVTKIQRKAARVVNSYGG